MCALDYNYGKVMEACQHRRWCILFDQPVLNPEPRTLNLFYLHLLKQAGIKSGNRKRFG